MNPLKRIVVVGRDADAWITALALQRFYGRRPISIDIELVELPSLLRKQDVYSTLPVLRALHNMLGINESQLLRCTMGTYSMGQRFSNWSGQGSDFLHPYDSHGVEIGGIAFIHYWLKARKSGLEVPLEDFSLGAAAAKQGRFDALRDDKPHFSRATHGYHLSAVEYVGAMASLALKEGVAHSYGQIHSVKVANGNISEIELSDGRCLSADLFIDASGEDAALIGRLEESSFESWQHWFPADSLLVAEAPALSPMPTFAQIAAVESGWLGIYPLVKRTALRMLFARGQASGDSVLESVAGQSGMPLENLVASSFSSGIRRKSWCGNCLALGCSSARLEPLDATDLNVLHTGLAYFISLFPVSESFSEEAALFNQKMQSHVERLRDFSLVHYILNRRYEEEFWDQCRGPVLPEELKYRFDLFAQRAESVACEEEVFGKDSWVSILIGHGLLPNFYNPLVERVPEQELISRFQKILKIIAEEVDEFPSLQAHVDMMA